MERYLSYLPFVFLVKNSRHYHHQRLLYNRLSTKRILKSTVVSYLCVTFVGVQTNNILVHSSSYLSTTSISRTTFSLRSFATTTSTSKGQQQNQRQRQRQQQQSYRMTTKKYNNHQHNFSNGIPKDVIKSDVTLPTMIVFDLDDCLWSPEMYTLQNIPSIPIIGDLTPPGISSIPGSSNNNSNSIVGNGCIGMKVSSSNGPTVQLFNDARRVLYELVTNPLYKGIVLASASSSEEPTYSYSCLNNIEIIPGVTLKTIFSYNYIGRTGQLTSDKRTHFRLLHNDSQIPYNEMLFFDDCNWGDHCTIVTREFGVISIKTPNGLTYTEFLQGLDKYKQSQCSK